MRKNYARLIILPALMFIAARAMALPFSAFDPRSMAMGGTGVAVNAPTTAPFFNPAMLSNTDTSQKFAMEFINVGASLIDPGNLHTNWTTLNNDGTSLTNTGTTLSTNASTLATDITTLTSSITTMSTNIISLSTLSITDAASAASALTTLNTISTNLTTVTGNISTVSTDSATVSGNVSSLSSNISSINQLLNQFNKQPIQGDFGAAAIIGIPSKEWGLALYREVWGAMGGELLYNDSATITTITSSLNATSTALSSISTGTGKTATDLASASAKLTAAITDCAASNLISLTAITTCSNDLTAAQTALNSAQTTMTSTSTTVSSNATSITNSASTLNANTTMQSKIHIRGVLVSETGLSISHGQVTNDVDWSWGITPKVMQMQLYDATLGASKSLSGASGNDYLATYSTLNFDAGLSKTFFGGGLRTGIVVKNVIPQTFDFKNALVSGGTPVANGSSFRLLPQVRVGTSYEVVDLFTVAADMDLTRNDPAGLEAPSQFLSVGGEVSTAGWVQLRAGYRADMVNSARDVASVGFGLSPRLPFLKMHFDFAVTASPDVFNNNINNVTQLGVALKFGLNF